MKITNQSTLNSIKSEFHNMFPYLKLEFYHHAHGRHEISPKTDQVVADSRLVDLVGHEVHVDFLITPLMTVNEFENGFFKATGLGVQVYRMSNGIWLQTSATDTWTLEKQNGKGERTEADYRMDPIDITDFDVE